MSITITITLQNVYYNLPSIALIIKLSIAIFVMF